MHRSFSLFPALGRLVRRALTVALALGALSGAAAPARAQLPAPPVVGTDFFQFGGYAGLTVTRPEHPEGVENVDVSELVAALMAWGQLSPRASYLVELDMAKRTTETWTGRESDRRLDPVRLYLEYSASDLLRVRVGRFLTPVGQWNERHAEPLTWTPTRPLTTYRPFAKSLTGLLLAGEGSVAGHDAGYALFWAPSASWDRRFYDEEESGFAQALGARVAVEAHRGLTLGLSAARIRRSQPRDPDTELTGERAAVVVFPAPTIPRLATQETDEWEEEEEPRALFGADLRWIRPNVELTAEGAWIPSVDGEPTERGIFGQGAVRVRGPVWAVGRAETYTPVDGTTVHVGYAGLTVRAGPHFVMKFGRQFSKRPSTRIPDGWFLSFSSLF